MRARTFGGVIVVVLFLVRVSVLDARAVGALEPGEQQQRRRHDGARVLRDGGVARRRRRVDQDAQAQHAQLPVVQSENEAKLAKLEIVRTNRPNLGADKGHAQNVPRYRVLKRASKHLRLCNGHELHGVLHALHSPEEAVCVVQPLADELGDNGLFAVGKTHLLEDLQQHGRVVVERRDHHLQTFNMYWRYKITAR